MPGITEQRFGTLQVMQTFVHHLNVIREWRNLLKRCGQGFFVKAECGDAKHRMSRSESPDNKGTHSPQIWDKLPGTGKKGNLFFHTDFELRERDIDTLRGESLCYPRIDGVPDIVGKIVYFRPDIEHKFQA